MLNIIFFPKAATNNFDCRFTKELEIKEHSLQLLKKREQESERECEDTINPNVDSKEVSRRHHKPRKPSTEPYRPWTGGGGDGGTGGSQNQVAFRAPNTRGPGRSKGIVDHAREVQAKLAELQAMFERQMGEKKLLEDNAAALTKKMTQASDLIGGLSGEEKRWTDDANGFAEEKLRLVGDCAVACAFVSYCGPFNPDYRAYCIEDKF